MYIVIGILFFVAWLASYFFLISRFITYSLLFLAGVFIVIHFVMQARRRSKGEPQA
jgi:hypothetical protein